MSIDTTGDDIEGCPPPPAGGITAFGQVAPVPGLRWPVGRHSDENEPVGTMTFEALAESIRARRRPGDRRCLVVGVDGLSGAGKTTFAARLSAELSVPSVSSDALVPGWDGLEASLVAVAEWILDPLARGEPGRWRRFDWVEDRPAEWVDVPVSDVLVVEGCCVGVPPVADYLSYLVWLDTPADDRLRRLQAREDWAHYAPNFDRWSKQEWALQAGAGTADRADLVVDNSGPAGDDPWGDRFARR